MRFLFSSLAAIFIGSVFVPAALTADFSFIKKSGDQPGTTLLIVGGIDGDEPGGFHAAATLVTRYRIETGQLYIIPDLNTAAIRQRVRGDMNLKFTRISNNDPLYKPVEAVKKHIVDERVDLIINLHDGSGFYHPTRINSQRNPHRWGQSLVIDQKMLPGVAFGRLHDLSAALVDAINPMVRNENERFQIKNMDTATLANDAPAQHSLTWFALRQGKPALSIESSKSHPVSVRTYYLLLALEALMEQAGVVFSRDFELTPAAVAQVIRDDAQLTLTRGRTYLDLNGMRTELMDFPLEADPRTGLRAENPLIALYPEGENYRIHYGNNRLALLHPRLVEIDPEPEPLLLLIDGYPQRVMPGSRVAVTSEVTVKMPAGFHSRVVGLKSSGRDQQTLRFDRSGLNPRAAINRDGTLFRLEVYRGGLYSGMILLDFRPAEEDQFKNFLRTEQPVSPQQSHIVQYGTPDED